MLERHGALIEDFEPALDADAQVPFVIAIKVANFL
jgi:hypothetical protein